MEDHVGEKKRDGESDGRLQPTLLLMSGKMIEMVSKHAHFFSHALPQKYNARVFTRVLVPDCFSAGSSYQDTSKRASYCSKPRKLWHSPINCKLSFSHFGF